jgi:competence protein ComEC
MLLVPAVALLTRRRVRPWYGFGLALVAVLLWDSLGPLSAGFWLSFGAVGLLIAAGIDRRQGGWLRQTVKMQVVASFGLLSISVLWLQTAAWISPLANAVAIPLVGFGVVPLTLLGTVGLAIAPAMALPLDVAEWLMAAILVGLEWIAAYAPPSDAVATPGWAVALAVLAGILLVLPRGSGLRWLAVPLLLPVALAEPMSIRSDEVLRLTLLDVGHGSAIVLEAGGEAAVYDTGPASSGFDTGEQVLVPFLQHRGYRKLRWLIVSHDDGAHSGGTSALVRSLDLGEVRVGEQLAALGERPLCRAGERIRWQEAEFQFLWPHQPGRGGNEGSCVVRVHAAGVRILLTGDIGAASERALVREHGAALAADVVIVPHHGSSRSSTAAFVQASAPKYALVSVGYRNRYGFPRPDVVQRYEAVGADVRTTAAEGAIELRVLRDGTLLIGSHRRQRGRYYHRRVEL